MITPPLHAPRPSPRRADIAEPARGRAPATIPRRDEPELADKVAYLRRPGSYPGAILRVDAVETHMSWVFLAGDRAYKLKKPVVTEFLDYGTLAGRRRCCEEEVRLNERLAPGVYLGTVPLTLRDGHLELDGEGTAVEWLVVMRRLASELTLEARLAAGLLRTADVRCLATRLANFYREAPRAALSPEAYQERIERDLGGVFRRLIASEQPLPRPLLVALAAELHGFAADSAELLRSRAALGHVVEGHGDLRPEHVYLLEPPLVLDSLEFDPALRQVDAVDELAYLAMECDRLDADWVGPELLADYAQQSGDLASPSLVAFYKGSRAVLRADLALAHRSPGQPLDDCWLRRAETYLGLAAHYAEALR
jgi:aminoglycoside phosphotransferase family enzyme